MTTQPLLKVDHSALKANQVTITLLYRYFYKPLGILKPDALDDNPKPDRFAQFLGFLFLTGGSIALYLGSSIIGWGLFWLALPLALGLLIPVRSLGADAAANKGITLAGPLAVGGANLLNSWMHQISALCWIGFAYSTIRLTRPPTWERLQT